MKFTEGGFKRWGYEVAEQEFPDQTFSMNQYNQIKKDLGEESANAALADAANTGKVIIKDCIADAFLQNTLLKPEEYAVIATLNLNGDYISDQLAAMVGGIGIAPGANINYATGHAIFEATHGTAPDIGRKKHRQPLFDAALFGHDAGTFRLGRSRNPHHASLGETIRSGRSDQRPRPLHAQRKTLGHYGIRTTGD